MGHMAFAEPCVDPPFDRPVPGSQSAQMRNIDLPSSRFPGLWQAGLFDGLAYRIFANSEGDVSGDTRDRKVFFSCGGAEDTCAQETSGALPATALAVAQTLQRCLQGKELPRLSSPAPLPSPVVSSSPVSAPSDQETSSLAKDVSCALALLDED